MNNTPDKPLINNMQISHRYKFIFFSFPKTGSESIRELLEPYSDIEVVPYWQRSDQNPFYSHISPAEVKQLFEKNGWNYDEYYKFTFVRNPWARLVSLYNMIYNTRPPTSIAGKIRAFFSGLKKPGFKQWLSSTKTDGKGAGGPDDQRWQVYGSYSIASYILDADGNELVDEIVKLEEINDRIPAILKRIGIPDADQLTIPFINKRPSKKYSDFYDDETSKLISQRYQYDIERFGYRFEDILSG
jgi:hypothetical protein